MDKTVVGTKTQQVVVSIAELLGDHGFFQWTSPNSGGYSREETDYHIHLHEHGEDAHLQITIEVSWYERTVSAVMLGNPAIRHYARRSISFEKKDGAWYQMRADQVVDHQWQQLSNRELSESEVAEYLSRAHRVVLLRTLQTDVWYRVKEDAERLAGRMIKIIEIVNGMARVNVKLRHRDGIASVPTGGFIEIPITDIIATPVNKEN